MEDVKHVNGTTTEAAELTLPKEVKRVKPLQATSFPLRSIQSVIKVPEQIFKQVRNSSLPAQSIAEFIEVGSKSSNFRAILSAAEAYGLITKDGKEELSYMLAETGRRIIAPTDNGEKEEAIRKAMLTPTKMSKIFTDYNLRFLPEESIFLNALTITYEIPEEKAQIAREVFIENARFAGVLKEEDGKLFINLNFELNKSPKESNPIVQSTVIDSTIEPESTTIDSLDNTCFVISPIGEEESDQRKHANAMLKHLIQPVAEELGLKVVRADLIDKSGIINQQILHYLARASYCIADLSFNNPNVFYELGVRHTCQLPTIQIIRKGDKLPFDVAQGRTITIDLSDSYTVLDKIDSAKRELKEHLSKMIQEKGKDAGDDNPIRLYLPSLKVTIGR